MLIMLLLFPGCDHTLSASERTCSVPIPQTVEAVQEPPSEYELTLTAAFDREVQRGMPALVASCASHDDIFRYAERLTDISHTWLAAIAAHESSGCTEPLLRRTGFMHVMTPSNAHRMRAQELLGNQTLDWEGNPFHEAVLGGVMLQGMSVERALHSYRVGPNGNLNSKIAKDYELTVVVAAIMTRRFETGLNPATRLDYISDDEIPLFRPERGIVITSVPTPGVNTVASLR